MVISLFLSLTSCKIKKRVLVESKLLRLNFVTGERVLGKGFDPSLSPFKMSVKRSLYSKQDKSFIINGDLFYETYEVVDGQSVILTRSFPEEEVYISFAKSEQSEFVIKKMEKLPVDDGKIELKVSCEDAKSSIIFLYHPFFRLLEIDIPLESCY